MTVNDINFAPDTQAKLRELAAASGKDVPAVIREIVEADLAGDGLDAADVAAIREGLDQATRGEGHTADDVRDHFRRRGVDVR